MRLKALWRLLCNAFAHKLPANAAMPPARSLRRLLTIFGAAAVAGCVFPAGGIDLPYGITLAFPSPAQWFKFSRASGIDHFTFSVKTGEFLNQPARTGRAERSALPASRCTPSDILALPVQSVEFPSDHPNMFAPLWRALRNARRSPDPVRILHYGDSQIEADRISGFLRAQLQHRFGGGGAGFVSLNPAIPIHPLVNLTLSEGWAHSLPLVKSDGRSVGVGHMLSAASAAGGGVWIKISRRSLRGYPPLQFSQVQLLLANTFAPATLDIRAGGRTLYRRAIEPQAEVQQIIANIGEVREPLTLHFQGRGGLVLYGMSLDMAGGAALDNIPLRASAGLDFVKADLNIFKQCMYFLDAALIILQFGVNIVPHQTTNYKYYENQIYRQLKRLQQASPQTPILVMGVSDIARRGAGGVLASYPNVELVRNAQRSAAMRAGCAFWDTYQAMGGRNSIISWAYAQPPLATKDFCHFNHRGIDLVAELLWRGLFETMGGSE